MHNFGWFAPILDPMQIKKEHASSLSADSIRKLGDGVHYVAPYSASRTGGRTYAIELGVTDLLTFEEATIRVPKDDHDSEWVVRAWVPEEHESVEAKITGKRVQLRLITHQLGRFIPDLITARWTTPVNNAIPVPFVLEPADPSRPKVMVLGDYPTSVLFDADLVGCTCDYVDALHSRPEYQALLDEVSKRRNVNNRLQTFQEVVAGREPDEMLRTGFLEYKWEGKAPAAFLYTWLCAQPFAGGCRGFRSVPKQFRHDDDRIRQLIRWFRPNVIIASGQSAISRLALLLRPLIAEPASANLKPFTHNLADPDDWRPDVFRRDQRILVRRGGDRFFVLPVYDLRHFGNDMPSHTRLPADYWARFWSHLESMLWEIHCNGVVEFQDNMDFSSY